MARNIRLMKLIQPYVILKAIISIAGVIVLVVYSFLTQNKTYAYYYLNFVSTTLPLLFVLRLCDYTPEAVAVEVDYTAQHCTLSIIVIHEILDILHWNLH